jgi:hypothetical protein
MKPFELMPLMMDADLLDEAHVAAMEKFEDLILKHVSIDVTGASYPTEDDDTE